MVLTGFNQPVKTGLILTTSTLKFGFWESFQMPWLITLMKLKIRQEDESHIVIQVLDVSHLAWLQHRQRGQVGCVLRGQWPMRSEHFTSGPITGRERLSGRVPRLLLRLPLDHQPRHRQGYRQARGYIPYKSYKISCTSSISISYVYVLYIHIFCIAWAQKVTLHSVKSVTGRLIPP